MEHNAITHICTYVKKLKRTKFGHNRVHKSKLLWIGGIF